MAAAPEAHQHPSRSPASHPAGATTRLSSKGSISPETIWQRYGVTSMPMLEWQPKAPFPMDAADSSCSPPPQLYYTGKMVIKRTFLIPPLLSQPSCCLHHPAEKQQPPPPSPSPHLEGREMAGPGSRVVP